jgi:DNA-binding winged helix-turn-helix (wHTH) protein/TolB-like protein/tetratricopeptide (TPR) repeat protein
MKHLYEFGPFRLDADERLLSREGRPIALPPKVYETLSVLVGSDGRVLTKDELMRAIWPDTVVEEANLAHNISELRKALGDSPEKPQYIQTLPRRGYRFIAEVRRPEEGQGGTVGPPLAPRPTSEVVDSQQQTDHTGLDTPIFRRGRLRVPALLITVSLVGVALAAYLWSGRSVTAPHFTSLAVLPFKPLAASDRDESLELGMADTLIARLGSPGDVTVRPISSVRRFGGLEQDPVAAGKELQVDAVLDGSIQRAGDRIRMTVRLVSVPDGKTLWAESFDERFTDIFSVQDAVSRRVAEALALKLGGEKAVRLTRHHTEDPEAYLLYLKGQYFWNKFTPEGARTAVEYYNQALARDPGYGLAYAGLAAAHSVMGVNGWLPPKDTFPKAQAAAKRALEIDDGLAEAYAALAATEMFYEWDWAAAERELRRAIDLKPDAPDARRLYSYLLTARGRFDEAIAQAELNQRRLDPLSPVSYADLVRVYYFAKRYDEAVEASRKAREMDPNFAIAHLVAGAAYEQQGRYEEAIAELRQANNVPGGSPEALASLGHALAASGRRDEALRTLEELKRMSDARYVSPLDFAILYAGLGDEERTLEQLERAADDRVGWLINLGVEPRFNTLRSDPKYVELLRRMGLAS